MRAIVFHKIGAPLTVDNVPDPTPKGSEVVLKVCNCGICGSDLHVSSLPPGLPPRTVMGHEFSGQIVAVGPDAKDRWKEGDRVCALPYIGCGKCEGCLSGDGIRCSRLKNTGLGQIPGAYAEYVLAGSNELFRLPENVSFQQGALVEPLAVGLHAVNKADLKRGENVLIIGAGPVGLVTAMWAKFFGARHVIVSEKAPGRLALAAKFGATAVIDASRTSPASEFHKLAGGPPDVVFECVGVPGIIQQCVQTVRPRGRIVVVGVCAQMDTFMPLFAIIKELRLDFVVGYRAQDFQFCLDMLAAGRIDPAPMITGTTNLDRFPAEFEALKKPDRQCKILLDPWAAA